MLQIGYLGYTKNESFINYKNEKAYLTGDLGYIKDGLLFYKSRKDRQVKFNGYRLELADIEHNLQQLEYVEKAVVIPKKNSEDKLINIIAFVKLRENENKTALKILRELQKKIPRYMCPKIKLISHFPINQNGKCDDKRLMEEYL